ncbi:MAG: hypothetical protein K6A80_06545 [Saccharofermentans sp.]|nr:hypothetical protein [Saccharofermentans sp.]
MAGRIDISQLKSPPDKTEFLVARYFAALGKDVLFIPPSAIPGQHRPDIFMDGVEWEIKCPEGNSKRTIENNMRKALLQSRNVIFDLRHMRLSEKEGLSKLEKEFKLNSQPRKLYNIRKNGELIAYLGRH